MPPQIRSLDPAWRSCGVWLTGWHDPPPTLALVGSMIGAPYGPSTAKATSTEPGLTKWHSAAPATAVTTHAGQASFSASATQAQSTTKSAVRGSSYADTAPSGAESSR